MLITDRVRILLQSKHSHWEILKAIFPVPYHSVEDVKVLTKCVKVAI